jgi:hypothetical protein
MIDNSFQMLYARLNQSLVSAALWKDSTFRDYINKAINYFPNEGCCIPTGEEAKSV